MLQTTLIAVYLVVLLLLALYGFHRTTLVYLYYRYKDNRPEPKGRFEELPAVTVQLPLFNEMYVAERLLDAVSAIEYPRDRLQIQVLDDSTDETQDICRQKVAALRKLGLDIEYIHRTDRSGFKAGALDNGLKTARGDYILIFDADFLPEPDILHRTIHFFTDPGVGMVQVRWDHVNRDYSPLTETQALMLDGHFVIEHTARHRSGRFFNFNGTAGMWRRTAIDDAGGWQHDTLTEDMDLSYRAQMRGWQFIYLQDVVSPAELPVEMNSFKSQQFRWAKGSIQVAKKLLPAILRSKDLPFGVKMEAFFHLTNNFAYPLLMLLSILLLPNLLLRDRHGIREVLLIDLPLFFGTTLSIASFYIASQREVNPGGVWKAIKRLPFVLSLGIGLCINQSRAVFEALLGKETEFVRTPKHGVRSKSESWIVKKYRSGKTLTALVELGFATYFAISFVLAARGGHYLSLPFLGLFLWGYLYVGALSVRQAR